MTREKMSNAQFLYFRCWDAIDTVLFNLLAIFPMLMSAANGDMTTFTLLIMVVISLLFSDMATSSEILKLLSGITIMKLLVRIIYIGKNKDMLFAYLLGQSYIFLLPLTIYDESVYPLRRMLSYFFLGYYLHRNA